MFHRLICHAMGAMYPRSGDLPGLSELDPDRYVREELLVDVRGVMRVGILGATLAFVLLPVWTIWVPLPSTMLSDEQLDRHAANMANSDVYLIRNAAMLVKMVAGFHWARHARVRKAWALEAYPEDPDTWRTV